MLRFACLALLMATPAIAEPDTFGLEPFTKGVCKQCTLATRKRVAGAGIVEVWEENAGRELRSLWLVIRSGRERVAGKFADFDGAATPEASTACCARARRSRAFPVAELA